MFVRKLIRSKMVQSYDIPCQKILPTDEVHSPFTAMWCIVKPGHSSRLHSHHENEVFYIASGQGVVTIDEHNETVEAYDTVTLHPFSTHTLTNISKSDDLVYLTTWWEDLSTISHHRVSDPSNVSRKHRILVTATPPTPNGDLHLGHLSGPYTGADIFTRYARLCGKDAYYISGSDENQSYVPLKARKMGLKPYEVSELFGKTIINTLMAAKIEPDVFAFPSRSPHHVELTQSIFEQLYLEGKIIAKDAPTLYCDQCEEFLFEAHVSGNCPHCGCGSDGNACEQCGRPNDCIDLVNPKCKRCGSSPSTKAFRRLYFPLKPYEAELRAFHRRVHMSAHLAQLCESMLEAGLPDIAVSQQADWGIPVPVKGFENQRIYVWFEMAPGYLAATDQLAPNIQDYPGWKHFWKNENAEIIQFFGFDNGYFHAVLFPALFQAYDPTIQLPSAFIVNEFYRLEGAKFSTSRGHAIWGNEFLASFPADLIRFYLSYERPETEQTNFQLDSFASFIDCELRGTWQPWLRGVAQRTSASFGTAPEPGAWTTDHRELHRRIILSIEEIATAYSVQSFSLQSATRRVCELVRIGRRLASLTPYYISSSREAERRTNLALELLTVKVLAFCIAPIMPGFANDLWQALGLTVPITWENAPSFILSSTDVSGLDREFFPDIQELLRSRAMRIEHA